MLATKEQVDALVDLFHRGTRLTYKKGELVIRPGEKPTAVFFIESGLVKAYDITKYGEENLLIIRRPGEIFPLIRPIISKGPTVIYEALSTLHVWRIDQETYINNLTKRPELLPPLLDMTIEMYRMHSERIINLEYRTVRERLVSFLLTMSKRFGQKQPDGSIVIDVPLRQQDVASSINASRETAGREISRLEQKGLVTTSRSSIKLNDVEKLWDYFK